MDTAGNSSRWARMVPSTSLSALATDTIGALDQLAERIRSGDADLADAVEAVRDELGAPLEVAVAGRAGVGRSRLADMLRADVSLAATASGPISVTELAAFDVPGAEDPDLRERCVVYVVVDSIREADRRAVSGAHGRVVVALNKADLVGDGWGDAERRAVEIAEDFGVPTVAVSSSDGRGGDGVRREILGLLEAQWWRRVELIGPVLEAAPSIDGVGRDAIEDYLCSDESVLLSGAAAMASPLSAGLVDASPPPPQTAQQAWDCVQWWTRHGGEATESARPACTSIRRAYLRQWARLGGDRSAPVATDA
ncbi:hypothetical protein ABH922_003852 [Rhodococcus sp. 27YEA15]|uniref:Rab family GTPase n=1 Tax=Rhodococcus sp. 27YEA15 TaxID=3156259 RepID=UPI003C7A77E8